MYAVCCYQQKSLWLFTSTVFFTVISCRSFLNPQCLYFHMYFIPRLLRVNNLYALVPSIIHVLLSWVLSSTIWAAQSQNPILKICFLEAFLIPTIVSVRTLAGNTLCSNWVTSEEFLKGTIDEVWVGYRKTRNSAESWVGTHYQLEVWIGKGKDWLL